MVEDTTGLVDSIVRHLRDMLNSRQGHAPAQLDFGIPDISDVAHDFPEAIGRMQRYIRICIEKYEPRLTSVNVIHVENDADPFTLRFQITACLATSKNRAHVCFDTLMDASGRIQVVS